MPIGRDSAQHRLAFAFGRVDINPVQVIARFFRGNREPRAVNQVPQYASRDAELHRHAPFGHGGEILH